MLRRMSHKNDIVPVGRAQQQFIRTTDGFKHYTYYGLGLRVGLEDGNGYAGLALGTTRRTKGSAHIAHAHPPSNFDRSEDVFLLSQYISDRGDRCIACHFMGCVFPGAL